MNDPAAQRAATDAQWLAALNQVVAMVTTELWLFNPDTAETIMSRLLAREIKLRLELEYPAGFFRIFSLDPSQPARPPVLLFQAEFARRYAEENPAATAIAKENHGVKGDTPGSTASS